MTLKRYLDDAVASSPDKVFLRWCDAGSWRTMTFSEFKAKVERFYAVIVRLGLADCTVNGVAPRVAIMRTNTPDWMALYMAIAGSGLIAVPMDPHFGAEEAGYILRDSGASAVFTDAVSQDAVAGTGLQIRVVSSEELDRQIESLSCEEIKAASARYGDSAPDEESLASIVYTSGTTGRPKGACLTHGNFTANVEQIFPRVMFYETDNFLLVLPLFHVFAFTIDFLMPLRKRAEITLAQNVRSVARDMISTNPTVLLAVPLLVELLYARVPDLLGRLRVLGVGAAPMSKATINGLLSKRVYVLEGYGITECAPGVAFPKEGRYVPGTVGAPLDGMEWRICNPDASGAGELRVKGPNVMAGYWNNPGATAEAFDEDGFYCTGDIVRPDADGNLAICGRIKALIVNREGKNIYPEEIEGVLCRDPIFKDVLALGYHVGKEVGEHVGLIVVPNEDALSKECPGKSQEEMRQFVRSRVRECLRGRLAEYKMPRKIDVRFAPLERTASMKIKRFVYRGALDE